MSFLPPGATLAQAEAFARRLTHQLTPARRAALMSFQEALARAAGYPHAHAWHQRLTSGGATDQLPALYGAHPCRVTSWGKALWKAHPQWRTNRALALTDVQAGLARVWGWHSWAAFQEGVDRALDVLPSASRIPEHTPWTVAPTLDQLILQLAPSRSRNADPREPVTGGLHLALGTDSDGHWVGWGVPAVRWCPAARPRYAGGWPSSGSQPGWTRATRCW